MQSLGFHHLAVQARDVELVATFYRRILGLAELTRYPNPDGTVRSIWLAVDSVNPTTANGFLAIEAAAGERGGHLGYSMIALRIDPSTRGAIEAELEKAGVPIVRRTKWTLYVHDPEGNVVGLSHHPIDAVTV